MNEAALNVLPYLLAVIGFLVVYVLNGIKSELQVVNTKIDKIETDLHKRVTAIDRRHEDRCVDLDQRISHIEGKCKAEHS